MRLRSWAFVWRNGAVGRAKRIPILFVYLSLFSAMVAFFSRFYKYFVYVYLFIHSFIHSFSLFAEISFNSKCVFMCIVHVMPASLSIHLSRSHWNQTQWKTVTAESESSDNSVLIAFVVATAISFLTIFTQTRRETETIRIVWRK